jgi:ABC-2 type transport system permease protein
VSQIHDLGYEGTRTPIHLRFWVIAENVLSLAMRQRWLVRLPIIGAAGAVMVVSVIMYFMRFTLKELTHSPFGAVIPTEDLIIVMSLEALRLMAFVLSLAVACGAVADDLKQGAFQFYFSRAIRRRDYVLGKALGVGLVVGIPLLAAPLVLSIMRLFYAESVGAAFGDLHLLGRAVLFGLGSTIAFTLIPLGLSALLGQKRLAQIAWALLYLLVGQASEISARQLDIPELYLASVAADVRQLAAWIYDIALPYAVTPWMGPVALGLLSLGGLLILRHRVAALETANLGGA